MEFKGVDENYKLDILSFISDFKIGKQDFKFNTSGSTGKSKQISIKRTQLLDSAVMTQAALGLKPGYHALVCLNTGFTAGKMMLLRCVVTGMEATIVPPSSNPLKDLSGDEIYDFAAFVPFQLYHILNDLSAEKNLAILNRMKAIIIGGENVNYELLQQIQAIQVPVYHTFGMTETVTHFALKRLNGTEKQDGYYLLPGVEIKADDRGCLMVKSAITEKKWLVTNDLVDIQDNRKFYWKGRIDNVINTGGIKVACEEVEKAVEKVFYELGYKNRFIITGIPDKALGQKIVLVIEADMPMLPVHYALILEGMQAYLGKYEMPKEIITLNKFIETPTRKVDRKKTAALL